jgi:hypothetical protein
MAFIVAASRPTSSSTPSPATRAFKAQTVAVAELFATLAAAAMGHARELDGLNRALQTRTAISKAIGIVMERYGLDEDRAFQFLVRTSQTGNVKLRAIAYEIIAAANTRMQSQGDRGSQRTSVPDDITAGRWGIDHPRVACRPGDTHL